MFTGIIEMTGKVRGLRKTGRRVVLEIDSAKAARSLKKGGSISVNGACLTLVSKKGPRISFDLIAETRKRTTLGALEPGDTVHLELPLRWKGALDGHFVQGHVDGVGTVRRVTAKGPEKSFFIAYPASVRRHLAEKGSVAVDGVSLTLGKITKDGFWVHCIPHTLKATRLKAFERGARVNLEADILSKMSKKR